MALIFKQYMTPRWLENNALLDRNGRPISKTTDFKNEEYALLFHQRKTEAYQRILLVKIHDILKSEVTNYVSIFKSKTLTFSIEIALDYGRESGFAPGAAISPLNVMLTEFGYRQTNNAIGFKLVENPQLYWSPGRGPYRGVKGASNNGENLTNVTMLDSAEEPYKGKMTIRPQVFNILIKPNIGWGACHTAIDSGYLQVADYQMTLNLTNSQVALGLFSDENTGEDFYNLNYIDLSIYQED